MARIARLVVPGHPHHVTQRGVRRMKTFMDDEDYIKYISMIHKSCQKAGTEVWAYCLMPNHVHFIMVPTDEDGLRASLGEAHRQYTRMINFREGCRGHLWQERFHSFPMDESYLMACARYVELNPVRAGLVKRPEDWAWSSAQAHLKGKDDELVIVQPMLNRFPEWGMFLEGGIKMEEQKNLQLHTRTGRPLGEDKWVLGLENKTGRALKRKPVGRPKKRNSDRK
ncbi:MAG: transposase [Alphaproteobacteria bacterium]|nr:MAG: transposase [Alphaproteobacteria bacterium]